MLSFYIEKFVAFVIGFVGFVGLLVAVDALFLKYAAYLVAKLRITYVRAVILDLVPVACFVLLQKWLLSDFGNTSEIYIFPFAAMALLSWAIFQGNVTDSRGEAIPIYISICIICVKFLMPLTVGAIAFFIRNMFSLAFN